MANINASYTKLSKVKRHLAQGILHTHKVRPKDKKRFKSKCYEVFNLVYDTHMRTCQNFFECDNCKEVFKIDLSNGNFKMRRHPCYVAYEARLKAIQKNKSKSSSDESESESGSEESRSSSEDNSEDDSISGSEYRSKSRGDSNKSKGHSELSTDSDSESDADSNDLKIGKAIENFGKLCVQYGGIRAHVAARLAPRKWEPLGW